MGSFPSGGHFVIVVDAFEYERRLLALEAVVAAAARTVTGFEQRLDAADAESEFSDHTSDCTSGYSGCEEYVENVESVAMENDESEESEAMEAEESAESVEIDAEESGEDPDLTSWMP